MFAYLTPLVVPVFPAAAGKTVMNFSVLSMLNDSAKGVESATLHFRIEGYSCGALICDEELQTEVVSGLPDLAYISREYSFDEIGYVELSITASRPIFRKVYTESIYMFFVRSDGGNTIMVASTKYANPRIVDLASRIGEFCLVHQAIMIDEKIDAGNSALVTNPYDGPILAEFRNKDGGKIRKKLQPKTAALIDMTPLVSMGCGTTVLCTGNNRFPAWDVRHSFSNPNNVNSIDHYEMFRADENISGSSLFKLFRTTARRQLRIFGKY